MPTGNKPMISEELYNEIKSKFAQSEQEVPHFVLPYERSEPVLVSNIKNTCKIIAESYRKDLQKAGVNPATAKKFSESIRADLYIMSMFGYLLSDKSKDITWEKSMRQAWNLNQENDEDSNNRKET